MEISTKIHYIVGSELVGHTLMLIASVLDTLTLTCATVVLKKLHHISSYVHFIQSSSKHSTKNWMDYFHISKIFQTQRKLKSYFMATISSQRNLIVETLPSPMLFTSTFQPQNVFSDVCVCLFCFCCCFFFLIFVFVIVLVLKSKFIKSKFISIASKLSLHLTVGVFPKIFTTKSFCFLITFTFSLLPSSHLSSFSAPFSHFPFPSLYPWLLLSLIE